MQKERAGRSAPDARLGRVGLGVETNARRVEPRCLDKVGNDRGREHRFVPPVFAQLGLIEGEIDRVRKLDQPHAMPDRHNFPLRSYSSV
jgi:hypothetical protein